MFTYKTPSLLQSMLQTPLRYTGPALLAGMFLVLSACSEPKPEMNSALSAYANETFEPGIGLGDLELDVLSFSAYIEKIGMGKLSGKRSAANPSAERVYDFHHNGRQVSFMFRTFGDCRKSIQKGENTALGDTVANDLQEGPEKFFQKYPACKGDLMRLHSIAITTPHNLDHLWFKGQLGQNMGPYSDIVLAKKQMGVIGDLLDSMNHEFIRQNLLRSEQPVVSGTYNPITGGAWYQRGIVVFPDKNGQKIRRIAIFPEETDLTVWQ